MPTASPPRRRRPRQRRSRETVDAILGAAAQVLVEVGYARTTTNRIAEAAGVSVGSLYQYFPNKHAVLLELNARHMEDMLGLLQRSSVELIAAPVPRAVRVFVRGMVAAHAMDPALHVALLQLVFDAGLSHIRPMQQRARAVVRAWLELRSHELVPDDLDTAAFLLVTTVESAVHAALWEDPARLQTQTFEDELTSLIVRYLTRSE